MGKISNISTSECAGSFHIYHICTLLSSHLDKCIVTLGHFSTTNISTGGQPGGKGTGGSCPAAAADVTWPRNWTERSSRDPNTLKGQIRENWRCYLQHSI